jgi:hypothetical protein
MASKDMHINVPISSAMKSGGLTATLHDPRRLDALNLQWLCDTCHNRKRQRERSRP